MLRKKSPINQPDKEGLTPLQCACEDGNFEIAHLLKRAGATLKNEHECSFVGSAIRGDVRLMKTSVAKGVNVEYRDRWGMTAFLRAAEVGREGALKFLISQHIDLHQTNRDKLSAMDYAIKGSHHPIIQALCGANWDVNRLEEDGKSAFHLACEWQKGKIAQLLLQKGADPNRSSKDGNSPLHYAVGEPMSEELDGPVYAGADDISLVILLLKKGAKANVKNQEGETPIDIALRLRKPKMWNALVRSLTE